MSREFSPEMLKGMAEKLGLPPDAGIEAIIEAVDALNEKEDARNVDGAIAKGAIPASSRQVWLNSFKADPNGTKTALATMTAQAEAVRATYLAPSPAASPAAVAFDTPMSDAEANDALWRLGIRTGITPPKSQIGYMLVNEDGTPFDSSKKHR